MDIAHAQLIHRCGCGEWFLEWCPILTRYLKNKNFLLFFPHFEMVTWVLSANAAESSIGYHCEIKFTSCITWESRNSCVICLRDAKSMNHLSFQCWVLGRMLCFYGLRGVGCSNLLLVIFFWSMEVGLQNKIIPWPRSLVHFVSGELSSIWRESGHRCFKGLVISIPTLIV